MNRRTFISLIFFVLVICSTFYFHVCFTHANGDANTPTFELDVEPVDPQAWLAWCPGYQKNVSFRATLKGTTLGNRSIEFDQVTMTFDLGTPSAWEGVCMNFDGDPDTGDSPDLFFRNKDNKSGSGQTFEVSNVENVPGETGKIENEGDDPIVTGLILIVSSSGVTTVTVSVRVNDYGAVGILSVKAHFNYKDPVSGSTSPTGKADDKISIPLDNNSNDIADGWDPESETYNASSSTLDKNANYLSWDDTETGPGANIYTGDGFTVFEEYRGFYVKGEHTSIDPSDKDLFIFSEFDEGIGDASGLPDPIVTHEINYNEVRLLPDPTESFSTIAPGSGDPWVNFNSCGGLLEVVEQRALWVYKDTKVDTLPTLYGEVTPPVLGPVHAVDVIKIYEEAIQDAESATERNRIDLGESYPSGVPSTTDSRVSKIISLVIGHEIGHGVGLFHPFYPIYSSERPDIARPRYHDRLRYNATYCQYEKDPNNPNDHNLYRAPSRPHGPLSRCKPSFSVWDSGSTIMDYGSETATIEYHGSSGNRYNITSAAVLAMYEQSTSYLARIHNVEYMFVSKSVADTHKNKPKPDLQETPKPPWSPPNDSGSDAISTLTSSDDLYTSTAGSNHIANFSTDEVYSSVEWYVKSPSDTSDKGTKVETDTGNGSATTASLSYTFSADAVAGSYIITASVTTSDGVYEVSYTVELSTVPGSPSLGVIMIRSANEIYVSWNSPSDDGGSSITEYEYRYKVSGSTEEGVWTSAGLALNATVSGFSSDTLYEIEVRAKNSVGYSEVSVSRSFMTLITPPAPVPPSPTAAPGKPTGLSVVSTSNGVVRISWSAPSDDGGGIDVYEYRVDANNDGSWGDWESLDSSSTSATLNLENGRSYGIEVRAKNSLGSSLQSTKVTAMPVDTSVSVPSAPRNLMAAAENGQVRLSWNTPSIGAGIINYEYSYDTNDDGSWRSWRITNSTSTSYTVTGLTNETLYAFKVRARNAGGIGAESSKVTATPTALTAPTAPSSLTATYGNAEVTLSWTAPTSSGSSHIIRYEYRYATGQYPNHSAFTSWTSIGSTSAYYVVTGLTNGTQHLFQVRAVNNDNMESGTSNTAFSTPRAPVAPTAPSSLTARRGTGQVTLSWTAPTSSGSSDIIRYEYRYATGQYPNHSAFTSWTSIGSTNTTYVVTGLTSGTQHLFQVRAVNNDNMESGTSNTAFSTPQ